MLAPCTTPKLEDHPASAVSSICNLRMCHVVVTGDLGIDQRIILK